MLRIVSSPTIALLAVGMGACSPALDWREMQAEGTGIVATFPCKPDRHARSLTLAGQPVRMEMLVCSSGDVTFALSFLDLADPARVGPTLEDLRSIAASNIGAGPRNATPVQVPGMTPNPQASRIRLDGVRPDGVPVQEQAAFFAKGLRVYQATVIGKRVPGDLADTFIAGLRLPA